MNSKEKIFWEEFLELYESMPCLWKIKSSEYCNRDLKSKCYTKMVEKLKQIDPEANREKVVKKINIFRTNYKRDLKKVKKSEKSGAGADDVFVSSLWYFDKLKFLEDQECSIEGKCTMEFGSNIESGDETLAAPTCKKRKVNVEDNLLKLAFDKLTNCDDSTSILAQGWATQYEELSKAQKMFTRKIIADVLFCGCQDKLTGQIVTQIQKVLTEDSADAHIPYILRTSTPCIDEYTHSSQSHSSSNQYFEPYFPPSPEQPQTFFGRIVHNDRPIITKHHMLATETTTQSPISEYISSFVDE